MIDEKTIREAVMFSLKKIRETIEPPADPSASEKIKQAATSEKIDDTGARKKSASKSESEEVEEEDSEELDIRNKFDKDKNRELKNKEDDKFSYDIPKEFPKNVKFDDILKQLNFVRSGASAKDDAVKKGLLQYFENLKDVEKTSLLSMLSGFATIMNKAGDASDAPTPSSVTKKQKQKSSDSEVKKVPAKSSGLSPIVVGETARKEEERKIMVENNR